MKKLYCIFLLVIASIQSSNNQLSLYGENFNTHSSFIRGISPFLNSYSQEIGLGTTFLGACALQWRYGKKIEQGIKNAHEEYLQQIETHKNSYTNFHEVSVDEFQNDIHSNEANPITSPEPSNPRLKRNFLIGISSTLKGMQYTSGAWFAGLVLHKIGRHYASQTSINILKQYIPKKLFNLSNKEMYALMGISFAGATAYTYIKTLNGLDPVKVETEEVEEKKKIMTLEQIKKTNDFGKDVLKKMETSTNANDI